MKTFSKKLLSLLLVAVMLVAALPVFAFADDSAEPAPQEASRSITKLYLKLNGNAAGDFNVTYTADSDVRKEYKSGDADLQTVANALLAAAGQTGYAEGKTLVGAVVDPTTHNASVSFTKTEPAPVKSTIVITVDGVSTTYTERTYSGDVSTANAQAILNAAGSSLNLGSYDIESVTGTVGETITVVLKTKAYTGYTLKLTTVAANGTQTVATYQNVTSYSGNTSDVSAVLNAFGVSYDASKYETPSISFDAATKTFSVTLTLKPTADDVYTIECITNGNKYGAKSGVTYTGSFASTFENAQAILNKAGMTEVNASSYKKVVITKSGSVVTVDLRNTVVVKVYNNSSSYSEVTMDIGQPYVNYLGTNLINNSSFGGITVVDTDNNSTYYSASTVTAGASGSAKVHSNDVSVTIQRDGERCTVNFLRSDGTVLESRKLYAGEVIGTLPSYIVGNVPAVWTYNGKPVSATDVYNFKSTTVDFVPFFGGISDVYLDVYVNGNMKSIQTRVKVTDMVQNGIVYMNSEVKSAIASALKNSNNKNLTYNGFYDASTWADFIKTKNTNGAVEPYRVGDNTQRQGAVYLYVMVNNANIKSSDPSNPKTGDTAKLGVAAAVLAVAVVGFGAVTVVNKKKGVQ